MPQSQRSIVMMAFRQGEGNLIKKPGAFFSPVFAKRVDLSFIEVAVVVVVLLKHAAQHLFFRTAANQLCSSHEFVREEKTKH